MQNMPAIFNNTFKPFTIQEPVLPDEDEDLIQTIPAKDDSTIDGVLNEILNPSDERIVGGSSTSTSKWPWMAAIMRKSKSRPFCGGSLINRNTIVTAGHCVSKEKASNLRVRLGADSVGGKRRSGAHDYYVSSIRVHSGYKYPLNDIAIIKLKSKVSYSKHIKPILLPGSSSDSMGRSATVAGYGSTSYGGKASKRLRKVSLRVWDHHKCDSAIKDFHITSGMICAGDPSGARKDACQGDSGGPLMHHDKSGWRLIGIVSFGEKCAVPYTPGVYTRVSKYRSWIHSHSK